MTIKLNGFIIKVCEQSGQFNLFSTTVMQGEKMKGKILERSIAYGVSLERCVQRIIEKRLSDNESVQDLDGFLERYQEVSANTLKELREVLLAR